MAKRSVPLGGNLEGMGRWGIVALVSVVHGLAFASLLQTGVARPASSAPLPLRVSWIESAPTPATPEAPRPVAAQPLPAARPKPLPAKPTPPHPVPVTAPASAPVQPTAPAPVPSPPLQPALAPVAAEAPPVVPPQYQADYLSNPAPEYPRISRELREQGQVVLRVRVSPQGLPVQVQIHTSSGHERLDQAAQAAVGAWRFVPARRGNKAMEAWVLVPVSFTLRR